MSETHTTVDILRGKWSIQDMVISVRSLIDEAECHILLKDSIPDGLVQGLYKAISNIEAGIVDRRAALSLVQNHIGGSTEAASSQSEWREIELLEGSTQLGNNLEVPPKPNNESTEVEHIDKQDGNKDSRPIERDTLESLHDTIKAIQSVILFRMSDSMPSKASTTSSMVSFSILEEEMVILDGLVKHVIGSYQSSDDESHDLLETKLMALPTLLNALFNMEIREAADCSDINEKAMMDMVVANQQRTNVLRDIECIAKRVRDVTRYMQDDARESNSVQ